MAIPHLTTKSMPTKPKVPPPGRRVAYLAFLMLMSSCGPGVGDKVAPETDVLDSFVPNNEVDSVYVGYTGNGPALAAFAEGRNRLLQFDVDWTSSNPAVLRITNSATTKVSFGPLTGVVGFEAVGEGDAFLIATPHLPLKTTSGQPVVYRRAVSVATPPSQVKIVPVTPVILQVQQGSLINPAAVFRPKLVVRSPSGRTMNHVPVSWTTPDPDVIDVFRGDSVTLPTGTVIPPLATDNDSDIPTVTGRKPGLARLVATIVNNPGWRTPELSDTILVIVGGGEVLVRSTPVDNVRELAVSDAQQFAAQVKDQAGAVVANPSVTWSTSRPDFASIDGNGRLTVTKAAADGDTLSVRAFVPTLGITGLWKLTVYPQVAAITFTPNPLNMSIMQDAPLVAHLRDSSGAPIHRYLPDAIQWDVSSGSTVASLYSQRVGASADTLRLVSADNVGDATVRVRYRGSLTATVPVHVVPYGVITLAVQDGATTRPFNAAGESIAVGAALTVVATRRDYSNTVINEPLIFSTNQPARIAINPVGQNRATITGTAEGAVTLTVTSSSDVRVTTDAQLTVTAPIGGPATSLVIAPANGVMHPGMALQYLATARDATNNIAADCRTVNWVTDVSSVATMGSNSSANGIATGVAPGTTAVRAFCSDKPSLSAAAKLVVKDVTYGVTQVNISPRFIHLALGDSLTFVATTIQAGSTPPVAWSLVPSATPVTLGAVPGRVIAPASGSGGVKVVATAAGQSDTSWVTYGNAGSIKGTVVSTSGQYLGGSTATATPTGGGSSVVTGLNNDGVFYLAGLAPGSYTVTVRQQGNPTSQVFTNVNVVVGGTVLLTLAPFP